MAAASLAGLTLVLVPDRLHLLLASVALLYLVPVVAAAVVGGVVPAMLTAVAADLLVNFFFVSPYHTLSVDSGNNAIVLLTYIAVAAAVSLAVDVVARQHAATQHLAGEAAQARELAAIDQLRTALLTAVGHDLRTPLAGIKAAVSSLRQPDVDFSPDDRAELQATIEESADRLDDLIGNLLSMSRLQAGVLSVDLRAIPLDAVVATALLHVEADNIDVDVPDDLPMVWADAGLLERVVANLVVNAQAASPPGYPIRVEAEEAGLTGGARYTAARVAAARYAGSAAGAAAAAAGPGGAGEVGGQLVRLRVIDHGHGVPASDHERIFAPFQRLGDRAAGGGTGLGLAIGRGFTEAMNGTLVPSDTPGGGLTMTINLPVADLPAGSPVPANGAAAEPTPSAFRSASG